MVLMDEEMVAADSVRIPGLPATCFVKVRSLERRTMGRISRILRKKVRKIKKIAPPRDGSKLAVRGQVSSATVKVKARRVATPVRSNLREDHAMQCRPEVAGLDVEVMKETDEALHQKVKKGEVPGVISMVFRRGVLGHLDCFGFADLERKVEMKPDSIVRLYSMTKCIVSAALGVCLEEGLLGLDDHVSKYIPAFANVQVSTEDGIVAARQPITVLHLLTHTSGIGYGPMLGEEPSCNGEERFKELIIRTGLARKSSDPRAVCTLEQWCNELAAIPLQHHPGDDWLYGYGHDVIGRIIEVATGQALDHVIRSKVTGPLKMVDTSFEISANKWFRTSGMYRLEEEEGKEPKLLRLDSPSSECNEWIAGNTSPILAGGGSVDAMTGGMVSTARDYSRFLLMLLRKGELDGIRVLKKGQKGQVQSQWQTCTPQHQNQNVSNGNNAVRAETNGLASFWSPNPWSCNTAVPQPMLMPWFGDVKGGEKMVNSKPCQLEPLHEQQMPAKPAMPATVGEQAPWMSMMSALEWARSCRLTQEDGQKLAKMLRAAMPDHYDE